MFIENNSLLWPDLNSKENFNRIDKTKFNLPAYFARNLELELIAREICPHNYNYALTILKNLCEDPEVINYRLDILEDFLNVPELEELILGSINSIYKHERFVESKIKVEGSFIDIAAKLKGLENYIQCISSYSDFYDIFSERLASRGLKRLFVSIDAIHRSDEFKRLVEETATMSTMLKDNIRSITIGINFDNALKPAEAVILSFGTTQFKEKTLLSRFFTGGDSSESTYGVSAMHKLDPTEEYGGIDRALFKDLTGIVEVLLKRFSNAIKMLTAHNNNILIAMEPEFEFYCGAARLIRNLRARGIKMCRPVVKPMEERIFEVKEIIDVPFAIKLLQHDWNICLDRIIVTNKAHMSEEGRIFILTGPNQGGKTTYARALGVTQAMCQAGLFVPGNSAEISPVDWIYTHFPQEESVGVKTSRLTEECQQFTAIFENATRHSLIILNESISSTSYMESMQLAEDILKGLRYLGCRTIFVTHLHDLAARIEQINNSIQGDSRLISLVAGISADGYVPGKEAADKVKLGRRVSGREVSDRELLGREGITHSRTYKIEVSPSTGFSFARDIAEKYGISLENILNTIDSKKRGDRAVN